mmetsp:Transcript_34755/g.31315  ORF Transcript_34755/g.31315 Transcript_34755/m.31315 type:complete len:138 (+) Transcript_34755:1819-2232(+)
MQEETPEGKKKKENELNLIKEYSHNKIFFIRENNQAFQDKLKKDIEYQENKSQQMENENRRQRMKEEQDKKKKEADEALKAQQEEEEMKALRLLEEAVNAEDEILRMQAEKKKPAREKKQKEGKSRKTNRTHVSDRL